MAGGANVNAHKYIFIFLCTGQAGNKIVEPISIRNLCCLDRFLDDPGYSPDSERPCSTAG